MKRIESFDLPSGKIIQGAYKIVEFLGKGWEGEVYLIREISTGIEKAAKFFYPHRNSNGKSSKFYAKKLHKLRDCDIIIQYHNQGILHWKGEKITYLISELIEGERLSDFLKNQPGKKLHPFVALHLLHSLAEGMECVHRMGEYHGDLHENNIIIQRSGLRFDLKLVDLQHLSGATKANWIRDDVLDMIKLFYDLMGGEKTYSQLPPEIKGICCGLKSSLILNKFKTAGQLKDYLETLQWK